VQKAAWFYQLIRFSYASSLDSFGSQPHDMRANFPLIEQAHRRLAKVVVENKDFEKLIRQYDRPVSFFYCDPPYHATESYYKNVGEAGLPKKTMFGSGMRFSAYRASSCSPITTTIHPGAVRRARNSDPLHHPHQQYQAAIRPQQPVRGAAHRQLRPRGTGPLRTESDDPFRLWAENRK
jgi:hypothetical protein